MWLMRKSGATAGACGQGRSWSPWPVPGLCAHRHSNDKLTFSCLPVAEPQKHLESYLADCYDAIAVFLCIHIVLRFRNIAAKRDVPALDRSLRSGLGACRLPAFILHSQLHLTLVPPHLYPSPSLPFVCPTGSIGAMHTHSSFS